MTFTDFLIIIPVSYTHLDVYKRQDNYFKNFITEAVSIVSAADINFSSNVIDNRKVEPSRMDKKTGIIYIHRDVKGNISDNVWYKTDYITSVEDAVNILKPENITSKNNCIAE